MRLSTQENFVKKLGKNDDPIRLSTQENFVKKLGHKDKGANSNN